MTRFNSLKEKELLSDGYFFCQACLMPVSIGNRRHQDERYCRDCYAVIKGESITYGKMPTVEELNAQFTGDLLSQWHQKRVNGRS